MTTLEKIKVIDSYLENVPYADIKSILKEYREILVKNEENIDKVSISFNEEELQGRMGTEGVCVNTEIIVYEGRWSKKKLNEKVIQELRNVKYIEIRDFEECVVSSYWEGDRDTKLTIKDLMKILNIVLDNYHQVLGSNLIKYTFTIPQYDEEDYDFDIKRWEKYK